MSSDKLNSLKNMLWGIVAVVCALAVLVAFCICAFTRNPDERDSRAFSFDSPLSVSSSGKKGDSQSMNSEEDTDESQDLVINANGEVVAEGDQGQYFNAAEYWSSIANETNGSSPDE